MVEKEHWDSRFAFIMAAVGSAVGLGNVWRFPYICYENGGGAFLIPYFIALFTAGVPLLILEFTVGHWARSSPPEAFKKIGKKWEWVGWWTVLIPFVVAAYYVCVMAWCFSYMIYSLNLRWGANAEQFFFKTFLGMTSSPTILGGIRIPVLLGLVVVWMCIFIILYKGVKRIGKVVALTVPIPAILLIILTIRGLTLPGAMEGISYYLTPDFSKLTNANVWLAAYGQVFFSLSLAQGIMITYASFLKKKADITNNAIITALADAGTSFLAGFTVFSVIGYLTVSQGFGIDQLSISGPGLTFVTYPTAISLLPFAAAFFGMIFYVALLTFGIDSAFSMIEPISSGLHGKWKMSKAKATGIMCIIGFFASLIFATGSGIHWLKIIDHHIASFGLVLIGLVECIVLGWMYKIYKLREHANKTSDVLLGRWWDFLIKFVIPSVLIIISILAIVENITKPYGGYSWYIILLGGVIPVVGIFLISFVLMKIKGKEEKRQGK
ncbi:MAG: sodium-dependent transporter [Candidatus Thermoplasmatota archaeon]|nr:sodium-dependent transporter [Candidatus Thermoplasmatota archaeon]